MSTGEFVSASTWQPHSSCLDHLLRQKTKKNVEVWMKFVWTHSLVWTHSGLNINWSLLQLRIIFTGLWVFVTRSRGFIELLWMLFIALSRWITLSDPMSSRIVRSISIFILISNGVTLVAKKNSNLIMTWRKIPKKKMAPKFCSNNSPHSSPMGIFGTNFPMSLKSDKFWNVLNFFHSFPQFLISFTFIENFEN